jgi:myo-inositol 2-dehydrogenase / D-chiro-inositol 1-dehydrogenase
MMDGCSNNVGQIVFGTRGYTNCHNKIWDYNDKLIWEYEYPLDEQGRLGHNLVIPPFSQANINFINAIRTNNPINEANNLASSTLVGIMGRESAYTGKDVTWEEMMNSNLRMGPDEHLMGDVDIAPLPPVPGKAPS